MSTGDVVAVESLEPRDHATTAPPRYTEASLVKRLEELGIGRPSTWASIIQTIQDRGYVWKKGQALVPTWTAFAVVGLLEQHFDELVDYAFTARVETDLDAIAAGQQRKDEWLHEFYFGEDPASDDALPGLKRLVEENLDSIDAAAINTFPIGHDADGNLVVVKPGRYGPYVKRGDDTAGVPDDLPPDELTIDLALSLLAAPKADEPIGELDGLPVFAKNGRYGPYVQLGTPDAPPPGLDKPKMASLFKSMSLEHLTLAEAESLLSLPRTVGVDPADGEPVLARNGPHGPYVQKAKEFRSLDSEERLLTVTLDEALELLAAPKVYKRGGRNMAARGPLREFGDDPVSGRAVVARDGRFGVYVTDGETNASIGRGDRIEEMTPGAGVRAARHPPRAGRRQGRDAEEGEPRQEGPGEGEAEGEEAVSSWGESEGRPLPPYIALEGAEGSGKSTQAALLAGVARRRADAGDGRHGDRSAAAPDPPRQRCRRPGSSCGGADRRRRPCPAHRRGRASCLASRSPGRQRSQRLLDARLPGIWPPARPRRAAPPQRLGGAGRVADAGRVHRGPPRCRRRPARRPPPRPLRARRSGVPSTGARRVSPARR